MAQEQSDLPVLNIQRLSARFGAREILSVDSLTMRVGDRLGLSGRSGSGKTTLVRAIVDDWLGTADQESIEFRAESLCYVPQHAGLLPWYSLRDNIEAMISLGGNSSSLHEQRTSALLDVFDLNNVLDTAASQLSGGEFRRAALLLGMLQLREFCIFDEPLNGVDFDRKMVILDRIAEEIAAAGTTLLVVSHDPDVLAVLCTSVAFLDGNPARLVDLTQIAPDTDNRVRRTVRDRLTSLAANP